MQKYTGNKDSFQFRSENVERDNNLRLAVKSWERNTNTSGRQATMIVHFQNRTAAKFVTNIPSKITKDATKLKYASDG